MSVEEFRSMHQTPDVPGTSPVTDNPNPNNTQGADTTGPGTDTRSGRGETNYIGGNDPTSSKPGPEGGGNVRTFRCADVGNADCRWEAVGRTEDELRPQIERHGREAHGMKEIGADMWSRIRDAIRTRAA